MGITIIDIKSWNALEKRAKEGWLYRGQRRAKWDLLTSLDRLCQREKFPASKRPEVEGDLLREFKRACHHYTAHPPDEESIIEWTALMQHHGAPTRLLDFTYSIYVAAYFALEEADGLSAVWAIHSPRILKEAVQIYCAAGKTEVKKLQTRTQPQHEEIASKYLFKDTEPNLAVFPLTPFRLSERLRTQRASFLTPANVTRTFKSNLCAMRGHTSAQNVIQFRIPVKLRAEIIERLYSMNISRTSLFPGLDGFSESLGVFHPSFKSDPHKDFRIP